MDNQQKKVVFIVGPTASGKTDLAFDLSHFFPGEVVNADSKQVYSGINIIPGKDLPSDAIFVPSDIQINSKYNIGFFTFDEVRIWLLDIVQPTQDFSVYDYIQVAPPVLSTIQEHNRIPLVVGGSGFYIKALLDGIETLSIPQNIQLRQKFENKSVSELTELLQDVDPRRLAMMNESDRRNKRRLIRAIEVVEFGKNNEKVDLYSGLKADIRVIGLGVDRTNLKHKIDERITKRIEQGVIDEVHHLFEKKDSLSTTLLSMNGILPLFSYFEGKLRKDEAVEQWRRSEYLNAKKQMTWFQKDERVIWYDVSNKHYKDQIVDDLREWMGYEANSEY